MRRREFITALGGAAAHLLAWPKARRVPVHDELGINVLAMRCREFVTRPAHKWPLSQAREIA